jgi:HipA-like protein
MPVDAHRLIRKMRGGAQAHLLQAADGHCYVVKFSNNPQHRRILVNEWIAAVFLRYLGITTPEPAIIRVTPEFLAENPEVYFQLGSSRRPVEPGWHFGSRFPGDPARLIVYDFLPQTLLSHVTNRSDFLGTLAFDQWLGNADSRQAIFFRARLREWLPAYEAHPQRLGFVAQMIDHGFIFDGPHWRLEDSPLRGLYFQPEMYHDVHGLDDFQPWLDRIVHFPEAVVDEALSQIPSAWLAGDESELTRLLEAAMRRRKRVPDLLAHCGNPREKVFPNWC